MTAVLESQVEPVVEAQPLVITEPGLYDGIPDEEYHRDPVPGGSLSFSNSKLLMPPSCPAKFRYWQDHPRPPKRAFDLGHATHKEVLGEGLDVVPIDFENYNTKKAQQARDEAYAAGKVPLLAHEVWQVNGMAAAIRNDEVAAALFQPGYGRPEQSIFWTDAETGVQRRCRLDWLPDPGNGRLLVPDLKTCNSAEPEALRKALYEYGYFMQAPYYLDGVAAVGLDPDAVFLFVFVENKPPHLVNIVGLDETAMRLGHARNRRAIELYAKCMADDYWPSYSLPGQSDKEIAYLSLPYWAERRLEDELEEYL